MDRKYVLAALPGILIAVGAALTATALLQGVQNLAYAGYALLAIGVVIAIAFLIREGKRRSWSWTRIGVNLLFVFGVVSMVIPVVFGAFIYRNWWLFVLGWIVSAVLMLVALLLGRKMAGGRATKELDERTLRIRSEASTAALASASFVFVFLVSLSAMVDIIWVIPVAVEYLSVSAVYAVTYLYFRRKRGS